MAKSTLKHRVLEALRADLGEVQDGLVRAPAGRITGYVVSPVFSRMDHTRRQKRLWKALRAALDSAELQKVGAIATMAPAELTVAVAS